MVLFKMKKKKSKTYLIQMLQPPNLRGISQNVNQQKWKTYPRFTDDALA